MFIINDDQKIILRNYKEGDEEYLAKLMANNFPVNESIEHIKETWLWQFKNNVFEEPFVMVADHQGNIVAQYAVMKLRMNFMGREVPACLSTSTVTDTNYRGRGLFPKLAKLLYFYIRERNFKIIYGFPNEQSIRTFLYKLSWFKVCRFPLMVKPLNFKKISLRYLGNNIMTGSLGTFINCLKEKMIRCICIRKPLELKNITIEQTNYFPEGLGILWEKTHIKNRIAIIRDCEYLQWRYLKKPQGKYDVNIIFRGNNYVGYFITKLENKYGLNILFIMEIVIQNDDKIIMSYAIDFITHQAKTMNADIISLLALKNHPNYLLFIRKGFFPIPEKLFPNEIYFCAMLNCEDINITSIKNRNIWYITWGDTDII